MKIRLVIAGCLLATLTGCANRPESSPRSSHESQRETATSSAPESASDAGRPANFTHWSAQQATQRYYRCVNDAALPFATAPGTTRAIARLAIGRCEPIMTTLVENLRQENAGIAFADLYATTYGTTLKTRVIRNVTNAIQRLRAVP